MVFIIADATRTTTNEDNVKKNTENMRKVGEEPYNSRVYWLRKVEYIGLEALMAQQEKLAIEHMRAYIRSTKSKRRVEWTAYESDLTHPHRDASGTWCSTG